MQVMVVMSLMNDFPDWEVEFVELEASVVAPMQTEVAAGTVHAMIKFAASRPPIILEALQSKYVDNVVTLCHLRCPSGCPVDYTLHWTISSQGITCIHLSDK